MRWASGGFVAGIIFGMLNTVAVDCAAGLGYLEDYTNISEDCSIALHGILRKVMPTRRQADAHLDFATSGCGPSSVKEKSHGDQAKRFTAVRQGAGRLVHRHGPD